MVGSHAVVVVEYPVDLHRGRGCIAGVGVTDTLHHVVDQCLSGGRGARAAGAGEIDGKHAARIGKGGECQAAALQVAAADREQRAHGIEIETVVGIGTAIAAQGEDGATVISGGGQVGVNHLDVVIQHHGGLLGSRHRAAQRGGGGEIEARIQGAVAVIAAQETVALRAVIGKTRHQYLVIRLHLDAVRHVIVCGNAERQLAGTVEASIQCTGGIVAHQGNLVESAAYAIPRQQYLAIALRGDVVGNIIPGADGGGHLAASTEGGIQAAIAVVAHQGEIKIGAVGTVARQQYLAIVLQRQAVAHVMGGANAGSDDAGTAEGGIQRTVCVIPRQYKVVIGAIEVVAADHNLAVLLDHHTVGFIRPGAHGSSHLAASTEGGIQAAIAVVTHQCQIIVGAVEAIPSHHNLAVCLQVNTPADIGCRPDGRSQFAIGIKGGIQRTTGRQPDHGEIVVGADPAIARHHNPAIVLHRQAGGKIIRRAHGNHGNAGHAKGGVQTAVGVVTNHLEVVVGAVEDVARHQHLAVGLYRHGVGHVVRGAAQRDRAGSQIKGRRVIDAGNHHGGTGQVGTVFQGARGIHETHAHGEVCADIGVHRHIGAVSGTVDFRAVAQPLVAEAAGAQAIGITNGAGVHRQHRAFRRADNHRRAGGVGHTRNHRRHHADQYGLGIGRAKAVGHLHHNFIYAVGVGIRRGPQYWRRHECQYACRSIKREKCVIRATAETEWRCRHAFRIAGGHRGHRRGSAIGLDADGCRCTAAVTGDDGGAVVGNHYIVREFRGAVTAPHRRRDRVTGQRPRCRQGGADGGITTGVR